MQTQHILTKLSLVFLMASLFSCKTNPRTLYLKNNTDRVITLKVDKDTVDEKDSLKTVFRDSLNGRQLQKGPVIIDFGAGKWNKSDQEMLRIVLQQTSAVKEGSGEIFKLPSDLKVKHIGSFVNELVVKINEPKK